jgi:hypothetical protein
MPHYVIERQYLLPICERLLIEAPNLEAACQEALDEITYPWSEEAVRDFDNAFPTTISGAVELTKSMLSTVQGHEGSDQAALGQILYNSGLVQLPIPDKFTSTG